MADDTDQKKEPDLEAISRLLEDTIVLPALAATDDLPALLELINDWYLIALPGALADLGRKDNPQSLRSTRGLQRAVVRQKAFLEPIVANRTLRILEMDQVLARPGRGLAAGLVVELLSAGGLDVGRGMGLEALRRLIAEGWIELRRRRYHLAGNFGSRLSQLWLPEELYGFLLGLPRVLLQRARGVHGSRLAFISTMLTPADLALLMRELRDRVEGLLEAFGIPLSRVPQGQEHLFAGLHAAALTGPQQVPLLWKRPASPAAGALAATVGAHLAVQMGTLDQALKALQRTAVVHLYRVYAAGKKPGDRVEDFFAERYNIRKHDTLMEWRNGPMPAEGEVEPIRLNGGYVGEALREILQFLTRLSAEVISESRIRAHVRNICSSGAGKPDVITMALQRLVQEAAIIRVSRYGRQQGEDGYQSQTRGVIISPEEMNKYLARLRIDLQRVPGIVESSLTHSPFSHAFTSARVIPRSELEQVASSLLSIARELIERYNRPYAAKSEAEVKALGGQAFTLVIQCHQQPVIPRED